MSPLAARLGAALDRPIDPAVAAFARMLGKEAQARAVLFYGSNLRTSSLEGVLDFYVLLPGPAERGIWPRVSYRELDHEGTTLRAKVATMNLETFERAARGETLETTIWARFVQPSALAWSADDEARQAIAAGLAAAACTAARLAAALGPAAGAEDEYWRTLFRATYQAELRVEAAGREDSILSFNRAHFAGLLPLALAEAGMPFRQSGHMIEPRLDPAERRRIMGWWARRRRLGKAINVARLARAATTFEGGMRYVAWKVERHTGLPLKVTPVRERFPLLAVPDVLRVLWRARRGAGRR